MFIEHGETREGNSALQFSSGTPTGVGADSGMIQVDPGTTYTLSGWLSDSLSSGVIYIDWLEFNASNQLMVDGDGFGPTSKNQWEHGSKKFTTGASTVKLLVRVIVEGNATGNAFADVIELEKGERPIVLNGTFETNQARWNMGAPTMFIEHGETREGNSALQFSSGTPTGVGADSGMIQVDPGTTYTLSGWLSDSLSSGVIYIDWLEFNASNQLMVDGDGFGPISKNQWEHGSKKFTIGASTVKLLVRVIVEGNATGNAFADVIELEKGERPIVLNGTFETNQARWNMGAPTMFIEHGETREGNSALQFSSGTPTGVGADSGMIQVDPGTTYTLSGWLSDSLSSGVIYIDWLEFNASNQLMVDGDGFGPTSKNQWEHGSKKFTTGASTVKLLVRVIVEGNATGNAFADVIELVKGERPVVLNGTFET
ncbi:carbohydrate binding domain-containing protein, partial [Paenibacillus sp. WQ 127069]